MKRVLKSGEVMVHRDYSMQFKQRKGQAFETMMLVISVIVALAILGVLLNILGQAGGLFNPSDPVAAIKKELVNTGGNYDPGDNIVEVKLTQGQIINARRVTEDNAEIREDDLMFYLNDNLGDSVELRNEKEIKVNSDVAAIVVVCGDPNIPKYVVALARPAAKDALGDECRQAGGIP